MGYQFPLFGNLIAPVSGNMTSTNVLTSNAIDLRTKYTCAIQMLWTGTPTGTFSIQGSLDYMPNPNPGASPNNAGTWDDLGIVTNVAPAGSANSTAVDITATSFPWLRVVYTNATGSGTLAVTASSKG